MIVEQGIGESRDQFPVGMRVLAVDDDATCLLLLETLLRRCQYHVTTTSQAITALRMLRENKNKFDLVISDVHMPDMDGFKLLELVGLEMDLPVIMLSANGDPKLVMKGITHGACDYLLKPVRIEELKNIWQHVIRRKKFDNKNRTNADSRDKFHHGSSEATSDQKLNKKRKDQDEDDDEDHDENEDPTTQKKPRVVWSVELHRKFVAAVNQLGIDKAVPKKILDLMNVEKLTRENVASHLQKYRLYLKRISTVANQQANMVAALSGTDTSYLQMGSMGGIGIHNLAGPGQLHNKGFGPVPSGGMLGRLNSPAGLGMHGLTSTGATQLGGHVQTAGHLSNSQDHFQQVVHPGNNVKILPGMPMSLGFNQIHSNKFATYSRELPADITDMTAFSDSGGFSDAKMIVGSSNRSSFGVPNKPSSVTVSSLETAFPSHFVDHDRLSGSFSSATPSIGVHSNSLSDRFKQASLCTSNIRDGMSAMAFPTGRNPSDVSSISTLPIHLLDCKPDLHCNAASNSSNAGQIINHALQGWEDCEQDALYDPNAVCSSLNCAIPIDGIGSPICPSLDPNSAIFRSTASFSSAGQSNFVDPTLMKHDAVESSAMETLLRPNEGCEIGRQKLRGSFVSNNSGSLQDLVSGVVKQEPNKEKSMEGFF